MINFRKWAMGALSAALLATGGAATAQDMKTVNVATSTRGMLYVPFYVADVMGYFKDEGLDVNIQTMKSSAIMAAVIGGDMDIYLGTASAALRANGQGTNIQIFGSVVTQYASNMVLQGDIAEKAGLTAESSMEDRLAVLKGLKIGVTGSGSGTHQLALYMLERAGLDPDKDATVVFVGGSREVLAAFERDRIDAFILSNPTSDTAIMRNDAFLLFDMAGGQVEDLNGYLYISMIANGDWLAEDPERSAAIIRAVGKALQAIHGDDADMVRDTVYDAYLNQFDREIFDSAWAAMTPAYPMSPEVSEAKMQQAVDYLNKFSGKQIDSALIPKTMNNSYVEMAAPVAN